ncbi:MAG: PQQ-binding-like beta-propeller repeat protein [Bacteroidaceae bacterium]|nr:PQQ-binding-like beta-propeller repeat protein [Bacteroidaceae bacterium]
MRKTQRIAIIVTALVWTAVIVGWHLSTPSKHLQPSLPGADMRPEGTLRKADDVVVGEFFMRYSSEAPSNNLHSQWNGFRGPQRSAVITGTTPITLLPDSFRHVWTISTGEGHAAPAVWNGRVYILDYDEKLSSDALRCISLADGTELWRRWYRLPMKRNHGFSRTIPAIGSDGIIASIGPEGHVMCCDATSGDMLWSLDMKKRFESEIPFWYSGQCPLVDNNQLILAPAGKDTLIAAFDLHTGHILWATPNTPGFRMSHSSVMPITLGSKPMYVYAAIGGVCGISADVSDRGKLLWQSTEWKPSVIAPSPILIAPDKLFFGAGYGAGGAQLQVTPNSGTWTAKVIEQYKAEQGLSTEQQTPIFYNNKIITILPKNGGPMRERICIYSPTDLHKPMWTSSSDERFGLGPYIIIDDKLFVLKETGELYVYKIDNNSPTLLHHQTVIHDAADAWGPMAYADGYLIVRDATHITCLQITEIPPQKTL